MLLYRLAKEKYRNDLSGRGAEKFGGRWNHTGTPLIYTGNSAPLVVLEYLPQLRKDHKNMPVIPGSMKLGIAVIEIPEKTSMITLREKDLPEDWKNMIPPDSTKDIGSAWASELKSAVLKVPSVYIPCGHSWNYLLNPLHREIRDVKVKEFIKYKYDDRIIP